MEALKLISSYLFTLVALFILDMLWIEYVAGKIYKKYLANISKDSINWLPAILFYLIFTLALFIFVVIPASSWLIVLQKGALFGFIVYSIYSLTNASFIKDWNWKIVISDILWGTVLGGVASLIAYYIVLAML
ncbi:MAG TPA: DUF2177 family protein [Patescibacteria group bacterium]|nr:DUF2177 family protein [Patescibacteria group bacterium]